MNDEKCRNRHVWSLLLRAVQIAFVEAAGSDEVAIYESAEDGASFHWVEPPNVNGGSSKARAVSAVTWMS